MSFSCWGVNRKECSWIYLLMGSWENWDLVDVWLILSLVVGERWKHVLCAWKFRLDSWIAVYWSTRATRMHFIDSVRNTTRPTRRSFSWNRYTSNGSWCMGIKGEMSGTVCVTFTWDMYIYIWVVYSLCFFCCLFITVTWWYVWCFEWASGNQEEVQACLVTLWLFIISCYSLYKTTHTTTTHTATTHTPTPTPTPHTTTPTPPTPRERNSIQLLIRYAMCWKCQY